MQLATIIVLLLVCVGLLYALAWVLDTERKDQ